MEIPMAKTPLSIIALFVSLIELFLAYPVTQLDGVERLIVVIFMTVFPFFVASAFFFILWHKPIHLYSPQDITPGLEDRYQTKIVEKTALGFRIKQLEEENQSLREWPLLQSTSILKPVEEYRRAEVVQATQESDLAALEREIRSRIHQAGAVDETAVQAVKLEMQQIRAENERQMGLAIREEMDKFRGWLTSRGFRNLPDLPEIVIEPPSFLNTYYAPGDNTAHFGFTVGNDPDIIVQTFFMVALQSLAPSSNKEETKALLLGCADYFACSYNENPYLGEEFASAAGLESGWIRDLTQVILLRESVGDHYAMSLIWSGACWELRELFGAEYVDSGVRVTLTKIGRDSTIKDAANVLMKELSLRIDEQVVDAVQKVFQKRGVKLFLGKPEVSGEEICVKSDESMAIPDNDPNGVVSQIVVNEDGKVQGITVNVDISHTYISDLTVTLISPSGRSVVLHDRTGGGADDIQETYDILKAPALETYIQNEEPVKGMWTLKVCDMSTMDVGKLNGWGLNIEVA
jgi:hypothetical protein